MPVSNTERRTLGPAKPFPTQKKKTTGDKPLCKRFFWKVYPPPEGIISEMSTS